MNYPLPSNEQQRTSLVPGWVIAAGVLALFLVMIIGSVLGGEIQAFMFTGFETVPFMLLALVAYQGINWRWAKALSLLMLVVLVGGMALVIMLSSVVALSETLSPQAGLHFVDGAGLRMLGIALGIFLSIVIGALGFIPGVRRWLSRFLPIDPDSFVHMIALVTIVAIALMNFVPLLFLDTPPLLALVQKEMAAGQDISGVRGDAGMLHDTLYNLIWTIPCTMFAVGLGLRRNLRETLQRLGLVRPTLRQVGAGLGLAVVLVVAVTLLSMGIEWVWGALGWPVTDEKTFGELLNFAMSPLGAVVLGVTAGLGEELSVRGVLQPRMGILLSNLFFTSLHALQYHWDSLLPVFLIGLLLGLIRKRTNTTTSAITHGTYDFLLVIASLLHIPWFS